MLPKATRRTYSAEYKHRIVQKVATRELGQVGAMLRREGLYSSQLTAWRRRCKQGALRALSQSGGRGPTKATASQELIRLERENARLKDELRKAAHLIIDVQK